MVNYPEFGLDTAGAVPFNPRAVVLIGDLERQQIEGDRRRSFELFRNELAGVEVVTFDELAAKAEALLELFRAVPQTDSHSLATPAQHLAAAASQD